MQVQVESGPSARMCKWRVALMFECAVEWGLGVTQVCGYAGGWGLRMGADEWDWE